MYKDSCVCNKKIKPRNRNVFLIHTFFITIFLICLINFTFCRQRKQQKCMLKRRLKKKLTQAILHKE